MPSMKMVLIIALAVAAGWWLNSNRAMLGPLNPSK